MPVNEEHGRERAFAFGLGPEQFDRLAAILAMRQQLAVYGQPPSVNQRVLCLRNARRHQKHSQNEKDPRPKRGCLPKDDALMEDRSGQLPTNSDHEPSAATRCRQ